MLSKLLPYDIAYKATEDSAYKINEDFAKQPIKNPTTWLLSILPLGRILNTVLHRYNFISFHL